MPQFGVEPKSQLFQSCALTTLATAALFPKRNLVSSGRVVIIHLGELMATLFYYICGRARIQTRGLSRVRRALALPA